MEGRNNDPRQLGPTATGKIASGKIAKGDKLTALNLDGSIAGSGKVKELTVVKGLARGRVPEAVSGDLVSITCSGFMPRWTQTLCADPKLVEPIQCTKIDPAVVSVAITSNNSPVAGRDGKFIVLHEIFLRLKKEVLVNVAITVALFLVSMHVLVCWCFSQKNHQKYHQQK